MIECMRTEARNLRFTEQRWISVKYHVMTEEERKAGGFSNDIVYYLDCKMPDDEQEIIVTDGRHVWVDTCIVNDGYALDSGHDWIEDVIAWMPLPEPYRESEDNMERLTYVAENGEVLFHPADLPDDEEITITQLAKDGRYKALEEIAERLANREQAEEQGLLLRLPCKVGDTLYRVNKGAKEPVIMMRVIQLYIKQIHKDRTVMRIDAINDADMGESCYLPCDIGERIFLTREEAEAKLKEMEEKDRR